MRCIQTIGELKLEVIVDGNYNTWIIGSKGISFYNKKGELEKDTEKESLVFPKVENVRTLSIII